MEPAQALQIAEQRGLDLVEVSPNAAPPVCRIMNFGKYLYQLSKKAHDSKKHQKSIQVKEVKFRPKTDEHDFQFKKNHIARFLGEGNKAKASIVFRGREMSHQEIGRRMMARLIEELKDTGDIEKPAHMEGNALVTIFTPRKAH